MSTRSIRGRVEKAKPKRRSQRTSSFHGRDYRQEEPTTSAEAFGKVMDGLRILENQRFALPPFSEHFERWFLSLQTLLSDLRSNPAVIVDDQFLEQYFKVVSEIECALKEAKTKEYSDREKELAVFELNNLLSKTDREYASAAKQLADQEKEATEPLSTKVKSLKERLESIALVKTGFLRGLSRKSKTSIEAGVRQELEDSEKKLREIVSSFHIKQEASRKEYEEIRNRLLAQISWQRESERDLEVDTTVEARHRACQALISAVHALAERNSTAQPRG